MTAPRRSVVREAWRLPPEGGFVVLPDELADLANRVGLSPAERLTLFGLLRAWNPRESPAPTVRASLDDVRRWTGLSSGRQSEVLRELAEGFSPPLLRVLEEGRRGAARLYSIEVVLRVAEGASWTPRRVRPVEGIGRPFPSDRRGHSLAPSRATPRRVEQVPSTDRGHSSLVPGETLEEETEEGARARGLGDEELRVGLLGERDPARRAAIEAEWIARKRRRREAEANGVGGGRP